MVLEEHPPNRMAAGMPSPRDQGWIHVHQTGGVHIFLGWGKVIILLTQAEVNICPHQLYQGSK